MTVTSQIGKAPVVAKCGLDLRRQFACRFQHETAKIPVMREQRQNRQREGRRLAGAGLGRADQIFSGENNGKARS